MILLDRKHAWYIFVIMVMMNCFLIGFFATSSSKYQFDRIEALKVNRRQNKKIRNLTVAVEGRKTYFREVEHTELETLSPKDGCENCGCEPSRAYEDVVATMTREVTEFGYYVTSQLTRIRNEVGDVLGKTDTTKDPTESIDRLIEDVREQMRSLMIDVEKIRRVDGHDAWRKRAARNVSDLVQKRLVYLQNPTNCTTAKKLICDMQPCGFGCAIHHLAYCMLTAYATQRTLILQKSRGWEYEKEGWEKSFLPLSETCTEGGKGTYVDEFEKNGSAYWEMTEDQKRAKGLDDHVIKLRYAWDTKFKKKPEFSPLSIPEDLAPLLNRLPGDPYVRWIGEIITSIFRPQPWLQEYIEKEKRDLDFSSPVVGVHVRRTDKLKHEAKLHDIEEYMVHVEEFYKRMEMERPGDRVARRVYLATDERKLLSEAMNKYPEYEFFGENGSFPRHSKNSLQGIMKDIYLLSQSTSVVCTLSSNICRLVYVLMQHSHPEKIASVRSLDVVFFVCLQQQSEQTAIYSHHSRSKNEIELKRGDVLVHVPTRTCSVKRSGWFSEGKNNRTGSSGIFPSYKVKNKVKIVKMPTYNEIGD